MRHDGAGGAGRAERPGMRQDAAEAQEGPEARAEVGDFPRERPPVGRGRRPGAHQALAALGFQNCISSADGPYMPGMAMSSMRR